MSYTGNFRGVYLNRSNVKDQPFSHFQNHYGYYAWTYYFEDGIDNINHSGNKSKYSEGVSCIGQSLGRR